MIKKYIKKIIEIVLPTECILCGGRGEHNLSLCQGCQGDLPWLNHICFCCSHPMEFAVPACGGCLSQPPGYFRTISLFVYDNLIANCIGLFKFQRRLAFGKIFGTLLARHLGQFYGDDKLPEVIIPMPLHTNRLKERGFNQALELAYPIAKALNLPIDKWSCERIKVTVPQSQTLTGQERQQNLKNAFQVVGQLPNHVAILDDVVTTTSTVSALTKVLLESGVKRVDVWCVARTPRRWMLT